MGFQPQGRHMNRLLVAGDYDILTAGTGLSLVSGPRG